MAVDIFNIEKALKDEIKRLRKAKTETVNNLHEIYMGKRGRLKTKLRKRLKEIFDLYKEEKDD